MTESTLIELLTRQPTPEQVLATRPSPQKTDLLGSGRFSFWDVANCAQAWYNMIMEEDTVMRGIMEWRRLRVLYLNNADKSG